MMTVTVGVERLAHAADLPLPARATAQAAGFDLLAAIGDPLVLEPLGREAVPTGLVLAIPDGYEGQVRPRSGLALRHGVTVANAPGTIDADYRGELKVLLVNLGREPFTITRGTRIAQIVFAPVVAAGWQERPVQAEVTDRGAGGFGSTGTDGSLGRG
jgi:dUTP pyrophosphatase